MYVRLGDDTLILLLCKYMLEVSVLSPASTSHRDRNGHAGLRLAMLDPSSHLLSELLSSEPETAKSKVGYST